MIISTIFERGDLPKIEIEIKLTFIRTPKLISLEYSSHD